MNGLREFISLENQLESSKVSLTQKCDFNLHDAFAIFDQHRFGQFSVHDLRDGLHAIGVYPTADECDLFFARYDTDKNHRITFHEFAEAFKSRDAYYAHMVERRGSNHRCTTYRRDDCFYSDTAAAFRSLWNLHFRVESASESVRQRLQANPYFNVYSAFNSLDLNWDGAITSDEIKRLIESRGFYVSHVEAEQIVKKFDANCDGRVTLGEFRDEITPKSPCKH